jgi:ABC-type nitrate/sulfonate/bicarbonate transport system ATPase subunit
MPWLELAEASFAFGSSSVFERQTLQLAGGPIAWIEGPSGLGKSTLLRIIAGHIQLRSGACCLFGRRIKGPGSDRTVCSQDHALLPWKRIDANIVLPLQFAGWASEAMTARVDSLLAAAGLSEARGLWPYQLSGGMSQRAAILRALAPKPDCVLLDEPFSALDSTNTQRMLNLIRQELGQSGRRALIVSHLTDGLAAPAEPRVVLVREPGGSTKFKLTITHLQR